MFLSLIEKNLRKKDERTYNYEEDLNFNVINQINTNLLYLLYNGLASKYYKQAQA